MNIAAVSTSNRKITMESKSYASAQSVSATQSNIKCLSQAETGQLLGVLSDGRLAIWNTEM